VAIVDNLDDFYSPELKRLNLEEIRGVGTYDFFPVDIRDLEKLREVIEAVRPHSIIHLAARAGVRPSLLQPEAYVRTNVVGTLNLLELARTYHVSQFVFASSSSVYGQANRVPFSESDPILKPLSVYAVTKVSGEALAFTYAHLYDLPVICVRIFTAFGPRQRPDLAIRKFAHLIASGQEIPIFGDGSMQRDYTYIDDVTEALELALEYKCAFEVFNLGNSRPIRLDYLVRVLEEAIGVKARVKHYPAQPGDMEITYADLSKSRQCLGYEPKVGFEEGIRRFVEWFRNSP
jgi:UDP-glucuronate 4-epimerase